MYRKAQAAAIHTKICSNHTGKLNFITRAELAAIHVALQECRPNCDETIATDSKCSMDKFPKHLRNPMLTMDDIHQPLLEAISHQIMNRARHECKTTLRKVKSHIGIEGNEQADALANAAAEIVAKGGETDRDVSREYCGSFATKFWPQTQVSTGSEGQTAL